MTQFRKVHPRPAQTDPYGSRGPQPLHRGARRFIRFIHTQLFAPQDHFHFRTSLPFDYDAARPVTGRTIPGIVAFFHFLCSHFRLVEYFIRDTRRA